MSTYYDNVNQEIFREMLSSAARVCEFGCGAGGLARAFRKVNPSVHYVGVDINAEQLAEGKGHIDIGLERNLDRLPDDWSHDDAFHAALPWGTFDHVIFGDVLEHLYAPDTIVRSAVKLLRPGGTMLTCVPNVQHWSVFAQLLIGHWPRLDAGLFDRTHIRWFTLDDIIRLITESGQLVDKVIPRVFPQPESEEFIEYLEPIALHMGVDYPQLAARATPLQYVLVSRPA